MKPVHAFTMLLFRKTSLLSVIVMMAVACAPEKPASPPDNMIGAWQNRYNSGLVLAQKITSVAYNPAGHFVVFALEPGMPGQANIFKMGFDPAQPQGEQLQSNLAHITNGPIRHVRISSDGMYTAFTGRTRELILLKNESPYAQIALMDEIVCMEFSEKNRNILALGDRKGRLIVFDLATATIVHTLQLFNEEITAIAFYKENQVLLSGNGSRIVQVDVQSGKITRTIETSRLGEEMLHAAGLKHCFRERINRVLYIESQDKIVTSHGWDYCRDFRVAIWDAKTGKPAQKISLKYPVFQMAWIEKLQSLVLVDHERNMRTLAFPDFNLSGPIFLPNTLAHYASPGKNEMESVPLGHVQSMITVGPNGLFMATGSYFKGGAGVLLSELDAGTIKHLARIVITVRGDASLFVREDLFHQLRPPA